jgi:hypothetical protein
MQKARFWLVAAAAVVLVFGLASTEVRAKTIQLADSAIRIEINDTDGDAGIQIFLDGEGWDSMVVTDPDGNEILDISAVGSVGIQGITELFFESAEPSFEEQPLEELLELFPEGLYKFDGTTTEGDTLKGKARLTHALPDGPVLVLPEEDDDAVDPENTVIEWEPVADPAGSMIVGYQVIVAQESGIFREFIAEVGPETTSVTVPAEFMAPGAEYKFEVLAIEASGNQTISEREFETE